MHLTPALYFQSIKWVIEDFEEEIITNETEQRIAFENGRIHRLLEKETEQMVENLSSSINAAFIEISFMEDEESIEGYSCYLHTPEGKYSTDLTLIHHGQEQAFLDFYQWKEVTEEDKGYQHLNIQTLSPKECGILYKVTDYLLTYLKQHPTFRLYFVTGLYKLDQNEVLQNLKEKADM